MDEAIALHLRHGTFAAPRARRPHPQGDLRPARVAARRPRAGRRPAAARRPRRLHRLRDVVPRGPDGRRGAAVARGRARAARGRPARRRQPRGRDSARARGRAARSPARAGSSPARRRARSPRPPTRCSSSRRRSRSPTATRRATPPRSPRSPRFGATTSSGLPGGGRARPRRGAASPVFDHERVVVVGGGRDWPTAQEAVLKLREGVQLAGRGAPHRADPPRPPGGDRRDRARLRARGRGPRGRAGRRTSCAPSARSAPRRPSSPTEHPAVGHRPLPAPHAGSRRASRRRPGHDPLGRAALGRGPPVLQLTSAQLGSTPRGW